MLCADEMLLFSFVNSNDIVSQYTKMVFAAHLKK
jgi:hypothetical protein